MHRSRFLFPLILVILPFLQGGCGNKEKIAVSNQVNIVLITIDTLRADRLGCYGYDPHISNRIDALASRGVQFNNCMSQSSFTPASHASILTGQNPYRHGLRTIEGGKPYKLRRDQETLATLLKKAGYRTAAVISAFMVEKEKYGLANGFEFYEQSFYKKGATEDFDQQKQNIDTRRSQTLAQRRADVTTTIALDWLREVVKDPFFLWVHYFDVHETFLIPPMIPGVFEYSIEGPLTDVHDQMYDVEIRYVDLMIGKLVDELYQLGLGKDTLIVLTSDHGQGMGDHDYYYHGARLYREQLHIPLIFSGASTPAGRKIQNLVRSIDIMPTILDLIGYPDEYRPKDIEGKSMLRLWENPNAMDADTLIAYGETAYPKEIYGKSPLFSIIQDNMKLIYHSEVPDESEFYDLTLDPHELNNIYSKEQEREREFIGTIRRLQAGTSFDVKHKKKREDKESEELLKSLGYLN